jgi:hypothetical protein
MKKIFTSVVFLLLTLCIVQAKTVQVGPGRIYATPAMASTHVADGDTVVIDSGLYMQDVAQWTANNLVLKAAKGFVRLNGNGTTYGGKAIWVISGNNVTLQYIEFYNASCVDHNGAGIRAEGANLTVQHCYFHDNEDGILAGDNANSDILIEYCSFRHNGYGDGYSHNLYVNHVHKLTFQYNLSHLAKIGHELKSRALNNYILYNQFSDDSNGTASRSIDLPNGGFTIIQGNIIEKGQKSQNSNFLEYGLEGLTNPDSEIYIVNNTFSNFRNTGLFIQLQNGTRLCKAYNNIFAGTGTILTGIASSIDTSHNIARPYKDFHFIHYHIQNGPAIQAGTDPGTAGSYSLTPLYEYNNGKWEIDIYEADSLGKIPRYQWPVLDCGAFSHQLLGIETDNSNSLNFNIFPNPSNGRFSIHFNNAQKEFVMQLVDFNGKIVWSVQNYTTDRQIDMEAPALPDGIYFLRIIDGANIGSRKILLEH